MTRPQWHAHVMHMAKLMNMVGAFLVGARSPCSP